MCAPRSKPRTIGTCAGLCGKVFTAKGGELSEGVFNVPDDGLYCLSCYRRKFGEYVSPAKALDKIRDAMDSLAQIRRMLEERT